MKRISIIQKEIFTLANIFSFTAIILGACGIGLILRGYFVLAYNLILLGVLCDMLDGYFARKYNTVSDFGKMLDNFADIFLYVLSILALTFMKFDTDILLGFFLLFFLIASVYRLCFFFEGGLTKKGNTYFYTGMPVYFHLILFQVLAWGVGYGWIIFCIGFSSFLMISSIPFRKFGLILGVMYIGFLFLINNIAYLGF